MALPTKPNSWPDLSDLGFSQARSADARAALLKVNAQMFVAAPARDREIIDTFETLVLGFLPSTGRATLLDIARILAPCADTPTSILDHLIRHAPETRAIILRQAPHLPFPLNAHLLATPEGRVQLAAQADLETQTIERLLVLRENAVENVLAANPTLAPSQPLFAELARRAQSRPSLARILLQRHDLTAVDEASLYLAANDERRRLIRSRIAASAPSAAGVPSIRLTEHDELLDASRQGDVRRFEELLTAAFGFPPRTDWRVLEIGRHALLALALKALGLSTRDATRIFLTLHPALAYPLSAVKNLVREMRNTPAPVASMLIETILGAQRS